ncbi:hypothetical protein OCU04_002317 [Sclerotinia nivalis]|uniref:Uncharacterized protein n=1 Tax=Sclerotinia nivalis TaxID=352851 RepID=A0A9X0DNF8_9HELO|nr:hypothetical protein OCU04_002317 [Sclerotinia nivalis]
MDSKDQLSDQNEMVFMLKNIFEELRIISLRLDQNAQAQERLVESCKIFNNSHFLQTSTKNTSTEKILPAIKGIQKSTGPQGAGTPTKSFEALSQSEIMHVYHNDIIRLRGSERKGILENEIASRALHPGEDDRWTDVIGDAWQVPEDGRARLTFSKRWLLSLEPSAALRHLEDIRNDEASLKRWFGGLHTRVVDLFQKEEAKVYTLIGGARRYDQSSTAAGIRHSDSISKLSSAPWNRLITLTGIESRKRRIVHELGLELEESHDEQKIPQLCMGNYSAKFLNFHITFYEIYSFTDRGENKIPWGMWRTGKLHSDADELSHTFEKGSTRLLIKSTYDVQGLMDRGRSSAYNWTILEIRPFTYPPLISETFEFEDCWSMLMIMMICVDQALAHVTCAWNEIHEYFDNLVSEKVAFLDPQYHDTLLVDDEAFSRSKKYFWAISTLQELDISITDNIREVAKFVKLESPGLKLETPQSDWDRFQKSIVAHLTTLESTAKKFREKKSEVIYLRDGLFNASGVMESRASTRQNENLRLLTFVRILFLPLSFCMSIWSINTELFNLHTLGIVATCVGLATYFTVFNLDNLMHKYQSFRVKFVKNTVQRMKQEDRGIWKDRATKFEKFINAKEADHRPSDWLIIQYRVRKFVPSAQRGYSALVANTIDSMKKDSSQKWVNRAVELEKELLSGSNAEEISMWRVLQYRLITIWRSVQLNILSIIKHLFGARGTAAPQQASLA